MCVCVCVFVWDVMCVCVCVCVSLYTRDSICLVSLVVPIQKSAVILKRRQISDRAFPLIQELHGGRGMQKPTFACYSSRGPRFESQYPQGGLTTIYRLFQVTQYPLLSRHVYTFKQNIYTHKINISQSPSTIHFETGCWVSLHSSLWFYNRAISLKYRVPS